MNTLLGGHTSKTSILTPKQSEQQSCKHLVLLKDNFLSEFLTKADKQKVLQNLGINQTIEWGEIGGYIEKQQDLLDKLKEYIVKEYQENGAANQIAYTNPAYPEIKTLLEALDKALYLGLSIAAKYTPSIVELGDSIPRAILSWEYNKSDIKLQAIDESTIDNITRLMIVEGPITANIITKITGSDGTKTVSATASLNFYPGIYFGAKETEPNIASLSKTLLPSRNYTVTIESAPNEYIWIYIPVNYGTPTFTVGGFSGGFLKVGEIVHKVTNYNIWRSDNHSLGSVTIHIT